MDHSLLVGALSVYVLALFTYAFSLAREGGNSDFVAGILLRTGLAVHTVGFLFRWVEGGLMRPPLIGLSETLSFFAWSMAGAQVLTETRFKIRWSGVFVTAGACVALLLALARDHWAIEPLQPILVSRWLFVHAASGFLAYGLFAVAAGISLFFLIRDGIGTDRLLAGFSGVCAVLLALAGGRTFFVARELRFGAAVPGGAPVLAVALGAFALHHALGHALSGRNPPKTARRPAQWLGAVGEEIDIVVAVWRVFFLLGMAALLVLGGALIWAGRKVQGVSFTEHPYRLMGIVTTFVLGLVALLLARFRPRLEKRLPKPDRLDRWTYQAILLGFLLMTVCLLSGSVWAQLGWTRYWGWDPKEIWALATWLVYVYYLHVRVVHAHPTSKSARTLAVIALGGFAVTLFAYLGSELCLSGLHHYGR